MRHTGKKESWKVPECPGDRHYERRDPRAGPALKVRERRKPLHPSSSPIAPVKTCSPRVRGRAASGRKAAPECKCLAMIIAEATAATGTKMPIRYHQLFFENPRNRKPSRLRTPEVPSKEKERLNAITVGDHTVTKRNVKSAHRCPAANVERKSKQLTM